MKFQNVTGQAYQFFPGNLANPNTPGTSINTAKTTDGNKIIFFSGAIPSKEIVLGLSASNIESGGFTKLMETPEFGLTFTYNVDTKKRYIRKTVIDAFELAYIAAGTIGWAAIIINNADTTVSHVIVTDSIGTWGDNQAPIIIDNKVGTVGSRNLFKNISIEITDKSNMI